MGVQSTDIDYKDPAKRNAFIKHLISDIEALDAMVKKDMFEKTRMHIGLEQELCLIDYSLRPMMENIEIIERLNDDHFTTELAKFNIEINLDPRLFKGSCFSQFENDLVKMLIKANKEAHKKGGKIILTGILPTIKDSDICIENITPRQRYQALNDVMTMSRGKDFEFNISGADELIMRSDSVLFESCNTSFQVHFQINPKDFAKLYNWSQFIAGPVLAAIVNSPMFLGKRLWKETRIAVFHQSVDIRKTDTSIREERPRVFFGSDWEKGNIVDHFRDHLAHFKTLVTREVESDSMMDLNKGVIPELGALSLHNSTVYKWNRPCYGISEGKPHIRIEARYLPSGPTITDEIANAAFWTGLMNSVPDDFEKTIEEVDFDDIKLNFFKAARTGLTAQFKWKNNKVIPAKELLLNELIPLAEKGLKKANIRPSDIEKYMEAIRTRIEKEKTGAQWMLESYSKLRKEGSVEESILAITEGIYQRQKMGKPVHEWELAEFKEAGDWSNKYWQISQVMTKDLIAVGENELVELIRNIMLWSNIRHVPVENDNGELVGIISNETMLSYYGLEQHNNSEEVVASNIMEKDPLTVEPDALTTDVIKLMRQREATCVCVVVKGRLVGIFTERDYLKFSEHIFDEMNRKDNLNK